MADSNMDVDYHLGTNLGKRRREEPPPTAPPSTTRLLTLPPPTPPGTESLALVLYNPGNTTALLDGEREVEEETQDAHIAKRVKRSVNRSSTSEIGTTKPSTAALPTDPTQAFNLSPTFSFGSISKPVTAGLGLATQPKISEPEQDPTPEPPKRRRGRPRKNSTASSTTANTTDTERAETPTQQTVRRSTRISSRPGSAASMEPEAERRAAIKAGKQKANDSETDDSSVSTSQKRSTAGRRTSAKGKSTEGTKAKKNKNKSLDPIEEEEEDWEDDGERWDQLEGEEEEEDLEAMTEEDVDTQQYAPKKRKKQTKKRNKKQWEPRYTQQRSPSPVTVRLDEEIQRKILGCFSLVSSQVDALGSTVTAQMQEFEDRQRAYREADRNYMESQLDALQHTIRQEVSRPQSSSAPKKTATSKRIRASRLPEEIKNNPNRPFFLVYLRDFIDRVLLKLPMEAADDAVGMETTDVEDTYRNAGIGKLLLTVEPLTDQEYNAFHARRLDAPKLTRNDFRFDFTLKITDGFNKQAIHMATRLFRSAVEAGEYNKTLRNGTQLPNAFLQLSVLQTMVETHVEYLFKMYEEASSDHPEAARIARLERTNRNSKKHKLFKQRSETVAFFGHLRPHAPLLESVGTRGMSEDEEEHFVVNGMERVRYRKVQPDWRGQMLSGFLQQLDTYTNLRTRSKIGRKGQPPGGRPRIREASNMKYKGVPPTGLPVNCFDRAWLQNIMPFEREALDVSSKRYNFTIATVDDYKRNPEAYVVAPSPNNRGAASNAHPSTSGGSSSTNRGTAAGAQASTSSGSRSQTG